MTCKSFSPDCFYCGNQLSPRHEHDHFPIPVRHDGEQVVCVCINCHDLKDRIPLDRWSPKAIVEILGAWSKLSAIQRIFLGKLIALAVDCEKQLEALDKSPA